MLQIQDHGPVREIRLDRPPANAINDELVHAVVQALDAAARAAEAVVISGRPGMFSAGLDVPWMLGMEREQLYGCWRDFMAMTEAFARAPMPVAFALTGHAPAGGIVMALFGDYRVMADGRYKTGVNEVQVGLRLPRTLFLALARIIGAHRAERIAVSGEMMDARRALEIGLVDELAADPEATVARAIEWCEQHLALPRSPMLETRAMARASLHSLFDADQETEIESFVNAWFDQDSRRALHAMVDRLKRN